MIEVPNERVFVAIAAYRDAELARTIESCIENAADPQRLRFGVCLQHDRSGPPETQPGCLDGLIRAGVDLRIESYEWRESKGGCWARHRTQGLYEGEGYTLQIDSHMQMASDWDRRLVAMMHQFGADKPLITGHSPLYDLVDGEVVLREPAHDVPVTVVRQFDDAGWIHHPGVHPSGVDTAHEAPRPTRMLSGGFVFTLGRWNVEVRQDPEHLYTGEELALTIRSFTWGYDLYNPTAVMAWHRHHPEGNAKYIYDGATAEVGFRDERAFRRLRVLLAGDPNRILEPYSTGMLRSVPEYQAWAGLDFEHRGVSEAAQCGSTPPPFTPSW